MPKKILIINTGGTLIFCKKFKRALYRGCEAMICWKSSVWCQKSGIGNRRFLFSGQCEYRAERLVGLAEMIARKVMITRELW